MEDSLNQCKFLTKKLSNAAISDSKIIFKDLCNSIGSLIISISKCSIVQSENNNAKCDLLLYFSQLLDCLQLLAQAITKDCNQCYILKECRTALQKRMNFCLDSIEKLQKSNPISITNQTGCLLEWMDDALKKISHVNNIDDEENEALNKLFEAKTLFENILSNALSVAQICLKIDSVAIRGSSQVVLESLKELEFNLTKDQPNKAMINLFVDTCGDKLCSLERKVDTAILKLTLNVFSMNEKESSLEKIFKFCELQSSNNQEELDDLVADFDLRIDKIMQIGLYAVYCSSNVQSGIKILNSMANLEFLEQELIPTMMMLHSDKSQIYRTSSSLYKNCWEEEEKQFKKLLFEIIDPYAFCEVIKEEISIQLEVIQEVLKKSKFFDKNAFEDIKNVGNVLLKFISIALINETVDVELRDQIQKCYLVNRELSKKLELLEDSSTEKIEKILKRCKVLKSEVKKLAIALRRSGINEEKNGENSVEFFEKSKNTLIDSLEKKSKSIIQNRSILYRSQKEMCPSVVWEKSDKNIVIPKLASSFASRNNCTKTELRIVDILDDLSRLSIFEPKFDVEMVENGQKNQISNK